MMSDNQDFSRGIKRKLEDSDDSSSKKLKKPISSNAIEDLKVNRNKKKDPGSPSDSVKEYRKKLRSSTGRKSIEKKDFPGSSNDPARKATKRSSSSTNFEIMIKKKTIENPCTLDIKDVPDDVLLLFFEKLGLRYSMSDAEKVMYDHSTHFIGHHSSHGANESKNNSTSTEYVFGDVIFPEVVSDASIICGFCIDNIFSKLSKLCKRFKDLIDKHHLFLKLNFFECAKTKKEYELLLDSTRRYHALTFLVEEDAKMQSDYLKKFMKNQRNLEMAEISLDDGNILQASDIKCWLENFKELKTLHIDIGSASIIKSDEEDYMITFPNLTRLVIKGLNEAMCNNLWDFIDAPNLHCMEIALTGAIYNDGFYVDWVEVLPFVERFSSSLQNLKVINQDAAEIDVFLHWTPEYLLIHNIDGPNNQLIEFLRNRLSDLKKIEIENCKYKDLNNLILQEARGLKEILVDLDFLNDHQNLIFDYALS